MGKVTTPYYLVVFDSPQGRIASLPMEIDRDTMERDNVEHEAFRRAVTNQGPILEAVMDTASGSDAQFEVYTIGQGNRKQPALLTYTRAECVVDEHFDSAEEIREVVDDA